MRMIILATTPDGSYMVVDTAGTPRQGAGTAATSGAQSEEQLKSVLEKLGLTEKAIANAVKEVNEKGTAIIPVS